jgi:hypothetical protein
MIRFFSTVSSDSPAILVRARPKVFIAKSQQAYLCPGANSRSAGASGVALAPAARRRQQLRWAPPCSSAW